MRRVLNVPKLPWALDTTLVDNAVTEKVMKKLLKTPVVLDDCAENMLADIPVELGLQKAKNRSKIAKNLKKM